MSQQQRLECREGHTWTRPFEPGEPPKHCPYHAAKIAERLHNGKKEKAELRAAEQAKAEREGMKQEASDIDARINRADRDYRDAVQRAVRVTAVDDIDHAFDIADRKQRTLINLIGRRRQLQKVGVISD